MNELPSPPPKVQRSFFGRPSLGGVLTMVNLNAWVIFALASRDSELARDLPSWADAVLSGLFFGLSLPLLPCLWVFTIGTGAQGATGIVFTVLALALNAFLWGYGLAWCIERVRHWRFPPRAGRA